MSTFICTLEALKYAAQISRSVRFRYVRTANAEMGAVIVAEDAKEGQAAFVILHNDQAIAFDNICPHRSTELDWNPGDVFDESGLYLICATHGAMFEPGTGLCVMGPCIKQRLKKIAVFKDELGVFLAPEC
jgi:nitrite reductase/ring-hydroxylating ferredoxin subunit